MFDSGTIEVLRTLVDDVWVSLTPLQRNGTSRSDIGALILHAAKQGERDPARLREVVLRDLEFVEPG